MKKLLLGGTMLALAALPAQATTFFGVNYDLTMEFTSADHSSAHFILNITGINGPNDTEGGRYGLNAFAFNLPAGFLSASAPGFTFTNGGLNASGCDGSGNFFCFNDNVPKPNIVLGANSSLSFEFDVLLLAGFVLDNFGSLSFKVDWLGTKNNYDLISAPIGVSQVPIPPALLLFASGLAGLGALSWRRKRKSRHDTEVA